MSNDHNVTLKPVSQGSQMSWEMEYGGKKGFAPDSYPKIDIPKGDKDNKIEFKIVDGNGITFLNGPTKNDRPIYVQETDPLNPKKPAKGVVNYQITSVTVSTDGKTLTIKDDNGGAAKTLSYQLNFNNAPALDPIIQNGGGGGGEGFFGYIQSHPVESAIAFLLILAGLIALYRRRPQPGVPGAN